MGDVRCEKMSEWGGVEEVGRERKGVAGGGGGEGWIGIEIKAAEGRREEGELFGDSDDIMVDWHFRGMWVFWF